ncbi:thymidine kinase [Pseudactinotalea sp. HY158]|uniref:thymidine kinase n=1 Tax=Pseudactinotalea sp. HY158 TaxID=2654547 RepID=UPI00129D00DF|nr:thymidine kinase [Pseudactinotalea sp. HY158]QGH69290.1 thymidine kinase [Pseudactinotalea sp. HY158]
MAKLYFRYGAMNSGKSTALLQAAFNYEERGQRVLLAKPATDTKGSGAIVSRLGVTRETDLQIGAGESLSEAFEAARGATPVACLLVDEAQFLTAAQVDDLFRISVQQDVPVMAYGLRTDFRTSSFPGSARLLELAHSLEELKTICRCGKKAILNGRKAGERFVFEGDQVAIDGRETTYESLCGRCYLTESAGRFG